ncbi:MAG TPA: DUF2293 domain-containing protein [Thermoanaerobaculaceae bacterium]|nr:DUF2293 domain-containing protein [Thermoanaerobaculaceae bacterium]HRS17388.1 DUF2293 domain-containing protein [Thermoanaerobaculaceae bacterium]
MGGGWVATPDHPSPSCVHLAVAAHVRRFHTLDDELRGGGPERREARAVAAAEVEERRAVWRLC